jgi:hypothetical protein
MGGMLHFLLWEWPYLLMLILALFGVACTSVVQQPMMTYWMVLAPFIATICVVVHWREVEGREERLRLVWTQTLHWIATLLASVHYWDTDIRHLDSLPLRRSQETLRDRFGPW